MEAKPDWEGLNVEAGWYHNLRSMILDGTAAEMGGTAFLVYNALKCHANLDSGLAYPSQERLATLLKLSVVTISTATNKLVEMGLVKEHKIGRSKTYRLVERLALLDDAGAVLATAESTYIPKQFKTLLDEVKAYCQAGVIPGKQVQIVLNLALQTGPNATANFHNALDLSAMAEFERRLKLLKN